jgi:hypothetical protein
MSGSSTVSATEERTIGPISILGVSFFSTRHASASDLLAGRERPFTAPSFGLLVGRARRFTSLATQMHLEVCGALHAEVIGASAPPTAVFATCHGEIQTAEKLISDFRDSATVSSARFALSVHNTPSGMYSVAMSSTAPTTTVTGANAVAAGWLEAWLTSLQDNGPVLLSLADEPVPEAFQGPSERVGFAAGFLFGPVSLAGRRADLVITPCADVEQVNPLEALARAADAWRRDESASIALGSVQPGTMLQLRFFAQGEST